MSILIATDFSDASRAALRTAARLAIDRSERLVLLHCAEGASNLSIWGDTLDAGETEKRLRDEAASKLETFWEEESPEPPPPAVDFHVELASPGRGIATAAKRVGAEFVLVGATGHGRVGRALFGSSAEDAVRRSDVPVMVVPPETPAEPYERILAPVDFSDCSRASLEFAAEFARREGAHLEALHAYNLPTMDPGMFAPAMTPERIDEFEVQRRSMFDDFVEESDLGGLEVDQRLEIGRAHQVVVDRVRETGADLVVMGTHGRSGFERFILGSTASRVLKRLPCPVMTVRTEEDQEEND